MNKTVEKIVRKGQELVMKTTRPVRVGIRSLEHLLHPTRWSLGKRTREPRGEKFTGFYRK
ncbi:MAG: hypothetical protein ACOY3M_02040 [Patescibacteria group bacterium]